MTGRLPDPPSSWSVTCPTCGRVISGFGGMGATNALTRHRIAEHTADREDESMLEAAHALGVAVDRANRDEEARARLDALMRCTCPSGDGSLRWPCPTHPPTTDPVDRGARVVVSEYRVVHECGLDLATGELNEAEEMKRGHECPPHASTPASATNTSE